MGGQKFFFLPLKIPSSNPLKTIVMSDFVSPTNPPKFGELCGASFFVSPLENMGLLYKPYICKSQRAESSSILLHNASAYWANGLLSDSGGLMGCRTVRCIIKCNAIEWCTIVDNLGICSMQCQQIHSIPSLHSVVCYTGNVVWFVSLITGKV